MIVMSNEMNDSSKLFCCMFCFVFIFILLIAAIAWTQRECFENFTNAINASNETIKNVFSGGLFYKSLSADDDVLKIMKKNKKPILLVLTAPWCGYCKKLKSSGELTKVAKEFPVLQMDDSHPQTQEMMNVLQAEGFPAMGIISEGNVYPYNSSRDASTILRAMKQIEVSNETPIKVPESLNEGDVRNKIRNYHTNGKKVCTFFLAPWCGYCKKLKNEKVMEKLAKRGITVMEIDDKHPMAKSMKLPGFPSLICWKNGTVPVMYEGDRSVDDIMRFIGKL